MEIILDHVTGLSDRLRDISSRELNKVKDDEMDSSKICEEIQIVLERCNSRDRILLNRESSREKIILSRENSGENIETIVIDRQNSVNKLFFLEKIQLGSPLAHLPIDDPTNHELPAGFITIEVATQIIEILRHGGRLSVSSVHKILRLAYRSLKQLPNTIRVDIGADCKLHVVGDIHGE